MPVAFFERIATENGSGTETRVVMILAGTRRR